MALATWQATVQDDTGDVIVNPVVTVREDDDVGSLATIYDTDGVEIGNPVTGSTTGFVQFKAARGTYWMQAASGGNLTEGWYWDANDALTNAEVKAAYEANSNTNAFTDTEKSKLAGVEALAEVNPTDAEIVTSVNTELGNTDWQSGGGSGGSKNVDDRDAAVTWIAANTVTDGFVVSWPEASVVKKSGATMISDMVGFRPNSPSYMPEHFGQINGTADSAVIQAMADAAGNRQSVLFTPRVTYGIDAKVDMRMTWRTVTAYGAIFNLSYDGVAFDFNPDADPTDNEAAPKSYGRWFGGTIDSAIASPTATAAFRIYGCRQMRVQDTTIGSVTAKMTYGIMLSGLGGHHFENNRFFRNGIGIYCPIFFTSDPIGPSWNGTGQPISTSTFINNNWTMDPASNQKCVEVRCGCNRWVFVGGFCNGTQSTNFHFTNDGLLGCDGITFIDTGFEQAVAGGKFIHFEDTDPGNPAFTQIRLDGVQFRGNPSGAEHLHVDAERVIRMSWSNVATNAVQTPNGNYSMRMDDSCRSFEADSACRFLDFQQNTGEVFDIDPAVNRDLIVFPDRHLSTSLPLSGFEGDSFSTGTQTLDMSTLITGDRYPNHGIPPRGYTLLVQVRDSASGSTVNRLLEFGKSETTDTTRRTVFDLNGVPDNRRISQSFYVDADTNGDIWMNRTASGTNTMDIWVFVQQIHN